MGFNRKYISKSNLLENTSNIDKLLKADALVMDMWVTKFVKDLDPKERVLRNKIKEEQKSGCPDKHSDYSKLKSLSETLLSLKNDPSWLDIHFVQDKLGRFDLEIDEFGVLDKISKKAINKIIDYYSLKK